MPTSTCCGWLRHHARRFSQSPWHSGKGSVKNPLIPNHVGETMFFFCGKPNNKPVGDDFYHPLIYPFLIYGSTWHGYG